MTRYINLFAQQTAHQTAVSILKNLRKIAVRLAIILMIIGICEAAAYVSLQKIVTTERATQREYEAFVNSNSALDAKLRVFLKKNQSLHEFMKDDIQVSEKYELMSSLISQMGSQIALDSLSIDNDGRITFALQFPTYDLALSFLTSIEHTSFLTYFDELELKQFAIKRAQGDINILEFSGVFKPIHETIPNEH